MPCQGFVFGLVGLRLRTKPCGIRAPERTAQPENLRLTEHETKPVPATPCSMSTRRGEPIMQAISRAEARDLIQNEEDLTVVETLDEEYFNKFHLPGARNVPLNDSFDENIQEVAPDRDAPVLVYCMNTDCEASAKAARRMEELGYTTVYDYEAGKVDWKEAGFPIEEPSEASA
ncbi:MAG: rhodanese-like domain-containing protein [Planctomycetota bacterium]|nr:MAG: rhodanese-like domain-containing protein [Planctomycetota bacterium]